MKLPQLQPRTLHRINNLVMGLLLLAFAGLLAWLSTRYTLDADWTAAGRHSLSPASVQLLAKMKDKLDITDYAREDPELRDTVSKFVARYQKYKPDISLHYVNPVAVPDEIRNLGITVDGEMVLHYQGRVEHVHRDSEEDFTNALQRLLRTSEHWLAFLEGHGERSASGAGGADYQRWTNQLKDRGFHFRGLNLAETHAIPDNTSVLVIAGPQRDLLPGEVEIIEKYLDGGGNLLWLSDPDGLHGLKPVADKLGLTFPAGTIIDFAGQLLGVKDPTVVIVTASLYGNNPALRDFAYTTFYPGAGALTFSSDGAYKHQQLLTTGSHTWLETGPLTGEAGYDEGKDLKGPLTLGVALTRDVERKEGENTRTLNQRIVVIADGDFLSNTYIGNTGNLEMGLRLVNWLSHDEDLISIPAKVAGDTELQMDNLLVGVLGLFFVFFLPAALILAGAATWWRRGKQ